MEPGYAYLKDRISPIYHSSSSKAVTSFPLLAKKIKIQNAITAGRKDADKERERLTDARVSAVSASSPTSPNGIAAQSHGQLSLPRSASTSHIRNASVDGAGNGSGPATLPGLGSGAGSPSGSGTAGSGAGSGGGLRSTSLLGSNSNSSPGSGLSAPASTSTSISGPASASSNGSVITSSSPSQTFNNSLSVTNSNVSTIPSDLRNGASSKLRSSRMSSLSPTLVNTTTNSSVTSSIPPPSASAVYYIMVDTTTVSCLTNETGCKIVEKSIELEGYEVYIVEQWACERKLNATITSYTGNPAHKLKASILSLPKDTSLWSDVVRAHFEELFKLHLRPKETGQGLLFVSNLSSFPSNLNLVPVPEGDISKAVEFFDVNEDLRRTGCGGRLVLTIGTPPDSCADKFKQLFKTHDKVPITFAVRELVTLVQIGLFYCNLLQPNYVDGLLCNPSVKAISNWWDEIGKLRYHAYPKDGILGPTTVAAIIGFITGIRNRLASLGYKPPKDPFDAEEFVLCLKQFQKHERLQRTMKLDTETVRRIYSLTSSKGTNSDLFGIVKSTMKEVSGKQVQNVADSEVLDLERLLNYLQGRRARYLWLGKGHIRTVMKGKSNSVTGIPSSSLSDPEISGTNLDLKKAMRSVRKPTQVRSRMSNRTSMYDNEMYDEQQDTQNHQQVKLPTTLIEEQQPWLYENSSSSKYRGTNSSKKTHKFKKYLSVTNNSGVSHHIPTTLAASSFRSPYSTSDEDLANGENYESTEDEVETTTTTNEKEDTTASTSNDLCPFETDRFICCQQAHDDCSFGKFMDNAEKKMDNYNLRRTQSFSIVEDVVLRWYFDRPAPKLAKTYLSAMRTRQKLVGEVSLLGDISQMYDQKIKSMSLFLNKDRMLVNGLNSRLQGVMEKEINVKNLVNDVDALVARLHYESRMLTSKLRDVEESVDAFSTRVNDLEVRIDRVDKKKESCDIPKEYGYTESLLKRYLGWLPPLQKYLNP